MAWAKKRKTLWILIFLVFLFYSSKLNITPVHLNQDELGISLNALSISQTGYDLNGRFLPFYIQNFKDFWVPPFVVYPTALVLKVLPINEINIRLASVVMGIISISLISLLSENIFKSKKFLYLSLLIAASTPVLFINSRILVGNIYPVPFICAWLYLLYLFLQQSKIKYIFLASLFLGLGIHTYHAPKIMMPLYFGITFITLLIKFRQKKYLLSALVGFLIPILAFLPWLYKYPQTLFSQVKYAESIDRNASLLGRLLGFLNVNRYFSYFSPDLLFMHGDSTYIHSTGHVGAFLFPVVILLIFGILIALTKRDIFTKVLLLGLATYPIAPSVIDDPGRISRALIIIPFVVLLSLYGLDFLTKQKRLEFKLLIALLFTYSVIQFGAFYHDYFSSFRARAEIAYHGDIGGAYESVLKSTVIRKVDHIYIDNKIDFAKLYFDFYQAKFNRNVSNITSYVDEINFSEYPKHSLVLLKGNSETSKIGNRIANFERVEVIREPSGAESFYVYYSDK